jgi:hypothetical protein
MCARCGLRLMPLTATECFAGHARPKDIGPWTVWVCPEDGELVVPADMRGLDVARANAYHPLREANMADPNDTLITITGPILAGFCLAAIVGIGTSASSSGHPAAMAAIAVFALAAVLLLSAIQMLVAAAFPGLRGIRWPGLLEGFFYETGLLAFLAGVGLFLLSQPSSAAATAGLVVVGLGVVGDLVLLTCSWRFLGRWTSPRSTERA